MTNMHVHRVKEREKELQQLRMQASLKPLLSQGATYLILLAFITVFVLLVNWYNVKQLAQLKEEYGLDERQPAPEFWWRKALIYHIYVHSFQDSDGDGIGDINGSYFILSLYLNAKSCKFYIIGYKYPIALFVDFCIGAGLFCNL